MKKIKFSLAFIFCGLFLFSQTNKVASNNFVVGLTKISTVQLQFIKADFADMPKITSCEFAFKDNVLLIQTNTNLKPLLDYVEVEKVLLKYFNSADVYKKDPALFGQLQSEYLKTDKFILK